MKPWKIICLTITIALFCFTVSRPAWSNELIVAAGAGYKRPLAKIYRAFEEKTGITLLPVFGNMRQVLSQVEKSGRVGVAIGDQSFLKGSGLFEPFTPLGQGKLVLIYNRYPIKDFNDLLVKKIVYIAMPDPKKAIYGRAADQFLTRSNMKEDLKPKMIVTATVPQVSSFVIAGSAEAGFVNITDAIAMRESIGGWIEVPHKFYDPIVIGMSVTKGWAKKSEVVAFIKFMQQDDARKTLSQYGL